MSQTRVHQTVVLDDGSTAEVSINRRGCKGPWTKEDADAMNALVKAAVKQMREKQAASPADPERI